MINFHRTSSWPIGPARICPDMRKDNRLIWAVIPVFALNNAQIREARDQDRATVAASTGFSTPHGAPASPVRWSSLYDFLFSRIASSSIQAEPTSDEGLSSLSPPQAHTPTVSQHTLLEVIPNDGNDDLRHVGAVVDGSSTSSVRSWLSLPSTLESTNESPGSRLLSVMPVTIVASWARSYLGPRLSPPRSPHSTTASIAPQRSNSPSRDHLNVRPHPRSRSRSPLVHGLNADDLPMEDLQTETIHPDEAQVVILPEPSEVKNAHLGVVRADTPHAERSQSPKQTQHNLPQPDLTQICKRRHSQTSEPDQSTIHANSNPTNIEGQPRKRVRTHKSEDQDVEFNCQDNDGDDDKHKDEDEAMERYNNDIHSFNP